MFFLMSVQFSQYVQDKITVVKHKKKIYIDQSDEYGVLIVTWNVLILSEI